MAKQQKKPTKKAKETLIPIADQPLTFDSPESSLIIRGHYDPLSQTFTAEFTSGKTYAYAGVTPKVWAEMLAAESKGKFFNARIRATILGRAV